MPSAWCIGNSFLITFSSTLTAQPAWTLGWVQPLRRGIPTRPSHPRTCLEETSTLQDRSLPSKWGCKVPGSLHLSCQWLDFLPAVCIQHFLLTLFYATAVVLLYAHDYTIWLIYSKLVGSSITEFTSKGTLCITVIRVPYIYGTSLANKHTCHPISFHSADMSEVHGTPGNETDQSCCSMA